MTMGDPWLEIDITVIKELHRSAIEKYGGAWSPPKPGCLEASVGVALNNAMYKNSEDRDPNLLDIAAYLLKLLALNHCFVDGNKRVAWSALVWVFEVNNISLRHDQIDAIELVQRVVTHDIDIDGIVDWLADRVIEKT